VIVIARRPQQAVHAGVMTVSPLAGLSGSIPSQQIGLGNISTIVLSGTSGNQYCRFYCMGVLM